MAKYGAEFGFDIPGGRCIRHLADLDAPNGP
jgi:hypothetical protein